MSKPCASHVKVNLIMTCSWLTQVKIYKCEDVVKSREQVMNKMWVSHEEAMKKPWISHEQIVNNLWISHKQIINKARANCEQALNKSSKVINKS